MLANFITFNNKIKYKVRNLYKKLLLMTACCKQVKIINLCVPNINLIHVIGKSKLVKKR